MSCDLKGQHYYLHFKVYLMTKYTPPLPGLTFLKLVKVKNKLNILKKDFADHVAQNISMFWWLVSY